MNGLKEEYKAKNKSNLKFKMNQNLNCFCSYKHQYISSEIELQ